MSALYKFCASIKLAVVLLVALAAILATATFYESLYDTKTAQHLVYSSPWFAVFLAVLFINVLFAMTIRYPWKGYQTGFVITHMGILVILTGSMVTMVWGVDGQMAVAEGSSAEHIILDEPVLLYGPSQDQLHEIPAEFRWSPPRPDRPYRYALGEGVTAVVDGYYHHSLAEARYVAAPTGEPAVNLEFSSSRFGKLDNWLTPSMSKLTLGPVSARLQAVDQVPPLGEKSEDIGTLQILVDDQPFQVPVSAALRRPQPLKGTPYTVRVLRYLPTAVVRDDQLVNGGPEPKNPCVEVEVRHGQDRERSYLFSELPQLNTKFEQTRSTPFPVRALYQLNQGDGHGHEAEAKHHLDLFLLPDGRLHYRIEGGKEGELRPGEPIAPGWMDIELTAREVLPSARQETVLREFKPAKADKDKEGPPPAIRVLLEGTQNAEPLWLQYGDIRQAKDAQGKPFYFGYAYRTVASGVKLELIDFTIGYDPGTTQPASYSSKVRVEGEEHDVAMNQPLHRNGFTFFQSSYQEQPGGPWISVFSVVYDPGITLKYLGSIMLIGGIFTMFYIKPYMTGKRKYKEAMAAKETK